MAAPYTGADSYKGGRTPAGAGVGGGWMATPEQVRLSSTDRMNPCRVVLRSMMTADPTPTCGCVVANVGPKGSPLGSAHG
jgi:hypothetical protein